MLQIAHEAELAPQHTETGQRLSPQAEQGSVYGTPESQGANLSSYHCTNILVLHLARSQLGKTDKAESYVCP